jgi:ribosomal protein S6
MSKPKTRDEAHLQRKFENETTDIQELKREARIDRRVWKRQTSKLHRKLGKQDIKRALNGDDNE